MWTEFYTIEMNFCQVSLMTPQQAEQYLLSLSNMPRKEYMDDKAKTNEYLTRIQFFLDIIGNPEKQIPHYIHVTGTSGKGSVATYLSSILQASKKKVGLTISPHPTILRERWQVNNKIMTEKEFVSIVKKLKPALDHYAKTSPFDMISFFDITTIIALMYFAEKKVEWAVVEVGLGGRLDSTNVIPRKDVAVITNIGLDHTDLLGDTKEKIAFEKAGIITCPCDVFTMDENKNVLEVIQKQCQKKKAKLFLSHSKNTSHKEKNILLCTQIAEHLGLRSKAIQTGIQKAIQPLRFEVVSQKPFIILDGAHNEDKMKSTVQTALQLKKNVHLVVGFSEDKDVVTMIKLLATLKPKSIACTRQTSNTFRKVAHPKMLMTFFNKHCPQAKTEIFLDPQEAFAWSKKQIQSTDLLLVTGSIFLSGELRTNQA